MTKTRQRLRVLIVDDDAQDVELMVAELRRAGFDPAWQRVDTEAAYIAALDTERDVILSDRRLPVFDATRALDLLRCLELTTPFVVVSGSVDDATVAQFIARGAADCLSKHRLAHLGRVVWRAVDECRLHQGTTD